MISLAWCCKKCLSAEPLPFSVGVLLISSRANPLELAGLLSPFCDSIATAGGIGPVAVHLLPYETFHFWNAFLTQNRRNINCRNCPWKKRESFWPEKLSHWQNYNSTRDSDLSENIWIKLTRYWESNCQFDSNILQLLGIPGLILVLPLTQLFRSKWL